MNTPPDFTSFSKKIWGFYCANKRKFPWRSNPSEYHVFVSEIMLQQTQTNRTISKFEEFIAQFPDFKTLAQASFVDVLRVWKGLGYNRRARWIQQSAQTIYNQHNNKLPPKSADLVKLPGIGPATSCSIVTFAFNAATIFIETNIRTVFLHEFFKNQENISDKEIIPLIAATVDQENPREWYYALMDYGVHLKKTHPNPSRNSKHHTKQSKFKGSDRQMRGRILEALLVHGPSSQQELAEVCTCEEARLQKLITALLHEKLVVEIEINKFSIPKQS